MADDVKVVARNKKAHHDYFIEETLEAGIELVGTEVKSIRSGKVNIKDSFARVDKGELYLTIHKSLREGKYIQQGPAEDEETLGAQKGNKKAYRLYAAKGLTLVPLKVYITRGLVKIELAVARGKKSYDKRDDLAKKDAKRRIERAIKERY